MNEKIKQEEIEFKVERIFNRWWKDNMYTTKLAIQSLQEFLIQQKTVSKEDVLNFIRPWNKQATKEPENYEIMFRMAKEIFGVGVSDEQETVKR